MLRPQMQNQAQTRAQPAETVRAYALRERGFRNNEHRLIESALREIFTNPDFTPNLNIRRSILRSRRFVRGDQYVVPQMSNGVVRQNSLQHGSNGGIIAHSLNFIGADGKKLSALVASHIPGAQVVAEDPENRDQIAAADMMELVMQSWYKRNAIKDVVPKIANTFWDSGTVFTRIMIQRTNRLVDMGLIPFDPMEVKAGAVPGSASIGLDYHNQGDPPAEFTPDYIDMDPGILMKETGGEPKAPPKPTPLERGFGGVETQELDYGTDPLISEALDGSSPSSPQHRVMVPEHVVCIYNTDLLEVTVPEDAQDLESCGWLRFDKVHQVDNLVEIYGKDAYFLIPRKSHLDTSNDLPIVNLMADTHANRYKQTLAMVWLTPSKYHLLAVEEEDLFRRKYPEGCVVHIIRNRVVRIGPGVITEDWVAATPNPHNRDLCQPSLASECIAQQILFNDGTNMMMRFLFAGIPRTIIDSKLLSPEDIEKMRSAPFNIIRAQISGMDLSKAMVSTQTASFPREVTPFLGEIRDSARETSGLTPPVFGGGPPAPTFREASMRRDSAMMQVGLVLKAISSWLRLVLTCSMVKMAKYGFEDLNLGRHVIKVHEHLHVSGWNIEVEDGIPISDIEARDTLMNIMSMKDPELNAALGVFAPANRSRLASLMGIRGMRSLDQELDAYCTEILKFLLSSGPEEIDGKLYATYQPNPDLENPDAIIGFMREWAIRRDGGLSIKRSNPQGYANVLLYLSEYVALKQHMDQQAQQAQQSQQGPMQAPQDPQQGGPPPESAVPPGEGGGMIQEDPGGRPHGSVRMEQPPGQMLQ